MKYQNLATTMRLVKMALISNIYSDKTYTVPVIVSQQGEGKSESLEYNLTSSLGCSVIKLDGGQLKECDLVGMPLLTKKDDGTYEEKFAPHWSVKRIQDLERYYFNYMRTKGLLNGRITMEEKTQNIIIKDKDGNVTHNIPCKSEVERIIDGDENRYSLNHLPREIQRELLESGEIKMVVYFLDEMNSSGEEVLKEEANFLLNRRIQGYKLPFFVFTVSAINPSSSNSSFNRTHFDPSLQDRILKIHLKTSADEWLSDAVSRGLDNPYSAALYALSKDSDEVLRMQGEELEDQDKMEPSLRSHTMCSHLFNMREKFLKSPFMANEDLSEIDDDIKILIEGKIGEAATTALYSQMSSDKDNYVSFKECFLQKGTKISKEIVEKLQSQSSATKIYTVNSYVINMMRYLETIKSKVDFDKGNELEEIFFNKFSQFEDIITKNGTNKTILTLFYKKLKNEAISNKYKMVDTSLFIPFLKYLQDVLTISDISNGRR